jgi:hypothetical protein
VASVVSTAFSGVNCQASIGFANDIGLSISAAIWSGLPYVRRPCSLGEIEVAEGLVPRR